MGSADILHSVLFSPKTNPIQSLFHTKPFSEEELHLIQTVADVATAQGVKAYLVGGYVRDKILGRPCSDMDITCIGSGIGLAEAVAQKLSPVPPVSVFKNFGTAHLHYHAFDIEFVGARKESYREDSRKPALEDGSLEDDLRRRDFTINAFAISLHRSDFGAFIDLFDGMKDLESEIIRTPLEPGLTFSDDPLRMMRAVRFASQLHFKLDEVTFDSICDQRERIKIISAERISEELNKILLSPKPSVGLDLLHRCGLLDIIFPELVALRGGDGHDAADRRRIRRRAERLVARRRKNRNSRRDGLRDHAVEHRAVPHPTEAQIEDVRAVVHRRLYAQRHVPTGR